MSASDSSMPGGQPSITQPMAGPCDSPKLVTAKALPKVLPLMAAIMTNELQAAPQPGPSELRGRLRVFGGRPVADVCLEHAVLEVLAVHDGLGDVVEADHAHQHALVHDGHVACVPLEHHPPHFVEFG